MQLLPFQLLIHIFGFLCQSDGIQVKVAVENGGATSESSGEGAGKAAQEQVLTCKVMREGFLIYFFFKG